MFDLVLTELQEDPFKVFNTMPGMSGMGKK
jgi:hypothetical protein